MAGESGKAFLRVEQGIGTVCFAHPKANSLNSELLNELILAIDSCAERPDVQVVLIASEGEETFCAGASFEEFKNISSLESAERFFLGFARLILSLRRSPKFHIARVQGKVVGGGLGLVAACDYAIANAHASARLAEFELGLGPFTIGPAVERRVGKTVFAAMSIDAQWRDAKWLGEHGLYAKVCDDTVALDAEVTRLLDRLKSASINASSELKKMFWEGTQHWEELLGERAKTSARLLLERPR